MDEKLELRSLTQEEEHQPVGGNHQYNLLPGTTGQDEVPRQGKILTAMMLLVVFSCLVLHIEWI